MMRIGFSASAAYLCLLAGAAMGCGEDTPSGAETDDHSSHDHGDANEESDESGMVGPATGAACPEGSALTYDTFAKQFMADYCLRCHSTAVSGDARMGAPGDHNFDAYVDVDIFAAHIDQFAGSGPDSTNTVMPPSAPFPSEEERKKLSEWIACNRPE
jgi:hypothetical protein